MSQQPIFYAALLLLFLPTIGCDSEDDGLEDLDISSLEEYQEYLEEEMEEQNISALSVVGFDESSLVFSRQLGVSNVATAASLTTDNPFLLASISKVVTATALLQLADDGKFELDDPINDYLPFAVRVPNTSGDITFRMLLTHTSGIGDGPALDDQYTYGADPSVTLRAFLEGYLVPGGVYYDAQQNFYDFEPGAQHEYSNEGSALVGLLAEEISGIGFDTYCKQNIFRPLGMDNTAWRLDEIRGTIVQPYEYESGSFEAIEHYTFTDYPNGGLRSTANDMASFLQLFLRGGESGGVRILEPATVEAMLTPQIPALDDEVGLHLFVMDSRNGLWGHDGGEQGVSTIMGFNPDTGVGAIVLTNASDAELEQVLAESYQLSLELQ